MIVYGDIDRHQEAAWDEWYDAIHLEEIVACPGFIRAIRYKAPESDAIRRFVTLYELSSADAFVSEEFQRARGLGPFRSSVRATTGLYAHHASYPPPSR
jgi:hypothetical protein